MRHEVVTKVSTLGVSIICRFDHILKYVRLFVCLHSESVEECLYYLLIWPHTRFCLFICLFVYPHSSIEMFLCIYINSVFFPHAWGDIFFSSETRFQKSYLFGFFTQSAAPLSLHGRNISMQLMWSWKHPCWHFYLNSVTCYNLLTPWTARLHFVLAPQVSRHTPQSWTEDSHKTIK